MAEEIKNILDKYPEYQANIGMEVHVQLKTNSKIFGASSFLSKNSILNRRLEPTAKEKILLARRAVSAVR